MTQASNNGDRFAHNICEEVAEVIGTNPANIVNIFNPSLIVLRGSVVDGNQFLFENINRVTINTCVKKAASCLEIVYSEEKSDIRLQGLNAIIMLNLIR